TVELKGIKTAEEEMLDTIAYQDDSKSLVTIDEEDIDLFGHVEEDTQNYAMMAYSSSNSGSDNELHLVGKPFSSRTQSSRNTTTETKVAKKFTVLLLSRQPPSSALSCRKVVTALL
nr:hypothetical protein [Tanacetum cinerariifolium]